MQYLTFDKLTLLLAVITGFVFTRRSDRPALQTFPYFLLLELLVGILGRYLSLHQKNNLIFYNLFALVQFSYYTWFFISADPVKKTTAWLKPIQYILPMLMLANTFLIQGPFVFNTYSFTAGCLLMVVLGCRYFYRVFKSPVHINLLRQPSFWVTVGVIFYFVSTVTMLGLANTLSKLPRNTRSLLQTILFTVNVLFYLLLIIAFTCRINRRKSLSSS